MNDERQTLTITISGPTNSGKTTLSHFLAETLRGTGLSVINQDDDHVSVLYQAAKLARLLETTRIVIKTERIARNPSK